MPNAPSPSELAESLFLLDGSALAYRAHFAMAGSNLSSSTGLPTGATFGFASALKRVIDLGPKYLATVFDTSAPTFRHARFPDYKATRQKMPEDLVEQLPWLRRVSAALGVPVIEQDGFEADDLMGTLARQAEALGITVYLVTGDKDFFQLVGQKIQLWNIMKRDSELEIQGIDACVAKFGVPPERVVDVLGLMGDSSDNVPGVPGIGPKTASKLMADHPSLEALLDAPGPGVPQKLRDKLAEFRDQALLSKSLVTIDVAAPVTLDLEQLAYRGPAAEDAAALFRELGFRTLAEEMAALAFPIPTTTQSYRIVRSAAELEALIARLESAPLFSVDTETTSLNPRQARLVGLSFCCEAGSADYVPLNAQPPILPDAKGAERGAAVLERLRPLLEDPTPRKCGQNAKYDIRVLRSAGIQLRGFLTDTFLAASLLEPEERERGLDALALRHFGHTKIKTEELIGRGKDQITMDMVPVEDVGEYAAEDADFTFRLAERFLPRLAGENLRTLHDTVEIPLIDVLVTMEETGVRVDREQLRKMSRVLEKQVGDLEQQIRDAAGEPELNVNSPQQLGPILFEKLEIHKACGFRPKRTKTGWATGQEVLEALSDHPLPALLLEFRALSKLLSTYINTLPGLVDEVDGRIHATFHQAGAATGRLSSSDPNLQNIPIRTDTGRKIRGAFVATSAAHRLLAADYSQVELRIMAHLANDESLIAAFRAGKDIHADTAHRVFGVPEDQVDPTLRSRAKAINFGILYGMGPQRLSRETGLTVPEAREFIDRYFSAFPSVRDFIEGLKQSARTLGYSQTILGRKRPLPDIRSSNGMLRSGAENAAVNTPIQGSAADILKVAMVRIHQDIVARGLDARMILTVHDELVFDVPLAEMSEMREMVVAHMEHAVELAVPLRVDVGEGATWLEAH